MPPGCTVVTPTPCGASSWRSESLNPRTANLLATYAACPGGPMIPNRLDTLTTCDPCVETRLGSSVCVMRMTACRLIESTQSMSSRLTWSSRPLSATPALLTSRCRWGWLSRIGLRHGERGVAVREVDDVRRHLPVAARGAQLGGDGLEPGRVAVEQDEVAAARGELARGRAPDPARGAGEHCRSSVDDVPLHVRASVIRGARAKRTPSSSSVPRVSSRTSLR